MFDHLQKTLSDWTEPSHSSFTLLSFEQRSHRISFDFTSVLFNFYGWINEECDEFDDSIEIERIHFGNSLRKLRGSEEAVIEVEGKKRKRGTGFGIKVRTFTRIAFFSFEETFMNDRCLYKRKGGIVIYIYMKKYMRKKMCDWRTLWLWSWEIVSTLWECFLIFQLAEKRKIIPLVNWWDFFFNNHVVFSLSFLFVLSCLRDYSSRSLSEGISAAFYQSNITMSDSDNVATRPTSSNRRKVMLNDWWRQYLYESFIIVEHTCE